VSSEPVTIKEWETISPESDSRLAGLNLGDQTTRKIAEKLTNSGKLKILELRQGLSIEATSYVGSLKLGRLRLTILPKLADKPDTFLALLRYAYGWRRLTRFSPVAHGLATRTFQDLLIFQLTTEAEELLSRGLHRRYEAMHDDLTSPRGKIDFQSLMRQGGLSQARLPCRHHPRLENTLVNRFLLSGLLLGVQLTENLVLRTRLRRLAGQMQETVASIRLDGEAVRCVRRAEDRMTQAYRPAREIIELLLDALGITLDSMSTTTPAPGFLFDMNRFFQDLLSRFLRENLEVLTVKDEYNLKGMLVYDLPLHNSLNRKRPRLRPDYVILDHQQKVVAILDAKYRDLWNKDLPPDMLYQLAIYAMSRFSEERKAVILYPTVDAAAQEARIQIMDPLKGQSRAQVILRPVNLLILEALLSQSQSLRQAKQRQALAHDLVFGNTS
jgi:5-methylcytosine-specific restriction enzyme subunit McrC